MKDNMIDGASLKECLVAAASALEAKKQRLNDLNVFPVPDGDTGTNMSLTMKSVLKDVQAVSDITVPNISAAASRGALKGARGNSGVILSQLLRGMAVPLASAELIDGMLLAAAMRQGVEMAYKAVMKPKEGTILTVARVVADACQSEARRSNSVYSVIDTALSEGAKILAQTTEMLPQLKKAGVVDAGGQGLMFIYEAFSKVIHGEYIPDAEEEAEQGVIQSNPAQWQSDENDLENITFAYCTEFFIKNLYDFVTQKDIDKLRNMLSKIGDSLVVVGDPELVKVHVHTNTPGKALQYAIQLGELDGIKIENMVIQHREIMAKKAENRKAIGISAVAAGDGLAAIFKDIGVDDIIEGGQTMNPSTEDILNQVKAINADSVIILPNNSNIILAAQQVQEMTKQQVYVVPTKSIPQGIAAMLVYNPEADAKTNYENMCGAIGEVKTGLVTYAVRDTVVDNQPIAQGDILGLYDGSIVMVGKDVNTVAGELVRAMLTADNDLVSVYYGEEVTKEQCDSLRESLGDIDADVETFNGGQPLYYYIISVE